MFVNIVLTVILGVLCLMLCATCLVFCVIAYRTVLGVKMNSDSNKTLTGVVQKIELTSGGAGNQVMTIDGIQYATWVDYKCWPPIGNTVRHEPYDSQDGSGNPLRSTKLIEDLGKQPEYSQHLSHN